uniref:Uncharacterized protein n=2 Tax=viral metagenome TaxID=1070528 RepID=A0A6M3KBD9_9ZZZZ
MTNEQILKKAIEKAVKNGWKNGAILLELINDGKKYDVDAVSKARVIFSHDFAKAFFPKVGCVNPKDETTHNFWQYHLQQMVLCEEPLKYLEKFL